MRDRPTLTTAALFVAVFAVQSIGSVVGIGPEFFALALPLGHKPWTLVTSVFAHSTVTHLLANGIALLLVGPIVSWQTSSVRFYTFFVVTGSLTGIVQVVVALPFGGAAVLGASGAIFALFGYLLVGNSASERTLSWLPIGRTGRIVVFVLLGALLTMVTAAPRVGLAAHFVGFCLGAGAGRYRLLQVER